MFVLMGHWVLRMMLKLSAKWGNRVSTKLLVD